jgi:hypothetical protein
VDVAGVDVDVDGDLLALAAENGPARDPIAYGESATLGFGGFMGSGAWPSPMAATW